MEGIYFYKSSTLNTSTNGGSMIQYLQLNDPFKLKCLNIYFTEGGSGWAHSTRGALYNSNSNLTMISIFPNPIINIANIHTNIENVRITLFDSLWRSISVEKTNLDSDIDLSSFSNGICIIKIENINTSEYWFKKLIVQ